ncbi:hypothetical protein [Rhizobium sp. Root482]|uniref:hypothetical protein n=1 Tax=Rhizobium sp. Root482 TaxID=1736543 RepID=UPI000701A601|nr:hypothetical protein [Rhizobium sp. Root482]KQY13180.1 hypothetical protein ASD31_13405 [Rhizobium sp. Root482]
MSDHEKVLASIAASTDADKLRRFRENAQRMGVTAVADAAFRRLVEILPEQAPGSIEHDFWMTIHAFEEVLRDERGKTVRLSRTRQKIGRVGVKQTLTDFAMSKAPTDGFNMLIERGLPELTGEALVLKHSESFDLEVQAAAKQRLEDAGVDITKLRSSW